MKILHTSDLHLGHALYGFERTEEQAFMLEQIAQIVAENRPDALLICGDVFHTSQPSTTAQTLFSQAIIKMRAAQPEMAIIITAGNHDSASRHEIFRQPWRALNVHTIGALNKENIADHIVEVEGKGFVAAVPFVNEKNLPENFYQNLLNEIAERNSANLPVILTAHTAVRGSDFTGHENATDALIGGIESLPLETFGDGYDYLALGHIHRPQFVQNGRENVRYSGTPLAVNFDENFAHSVTIINIEKHGAKPEISTVELPPLRPLVSLPADGFATWEDAKKMLADFPADIEAYIRLNVAVADFLPTYAQEEAAQIADGKRCRLAYINARREQSAVAESRAMTVQEFQTQDPLFIAQNFAAAQNIVLDDELCALFRLAVGEVE